MAAHLSVDRIDHAQPGEGQPIMSAPAARRGPGRQHRLFGTDLRRWRILRGLTQQALGAATLYSREFVTKLEQCERWPTEDFAARADAALETGGVLLARWPAVEAERQATVRPAPGLAPVVPLWPKRHGKPAADDAEPAVPGAALTALVAEVLRQHPHARIVLAVDPTSAAPSDGQATRIAPAASQAHARDRGESGDRAQVYPLARWRTR